MRIHLGHHFYGAGNLGDDFMLAGFLSAMRDLEPATSFTAAVPFPLEPLRTRFPEIDWRPYDPTIRAECIRSCDAWLGLGGSPFQSAQSRWFIDHLVHDAELCRQHRKPMFFLGVGVQNEAELAVAEVRQLVGQAKAVWTRDDASATRLSRFAGDMRISAAADLAHVFFRSTPLPAARPGRVTVVANMDFNEWPGQDAFVTGVEMTRPREHVWLVQETRELLGAERDLHARMPEAIRSRWTLTSPDIPGAPLQTVTSHWPSGEWLVTARFHAALAGAWSGSKVVVIATNEKLRAAAAELDCPSLPIDATSDQVARALAKARPLKPPVSSADLAMAACREWVQRVKLGVRAERPA